MAMAIVERDPGPGRIFYLLAVVPLILGVVAMVAILATGLPKMDDGLEQIVVPGERTLTLEPGAHTVFLETRSVVDGTVYAVDSVSGLSVTVTGADGTPVTLATPSGSSTYTLGGREGHSVNTFQIDRVGAYTVSAGYGGGEGPTTVIAVGQGFMGALLVLVFSALGVMFVSGIAAIGVVVWVAMARRRARRPVR